MTHSIHYVRLYSSDMLIFASFHAPFSALWSNLCSKKDFYSNPVILPLLSACPSFDREQSCLFWMTIVFHILDANTCSSPIYYISADVFVWPISIASFRPEVLRPFGSAHIETASPRPLTILVMVYQSLSPFQVSRPLQWFTYVSRVHQFLAVGWMWLPFTRIVPLLHTFHHLLGISW